MSYILPINHSILYFITPLLGLIRDLSKKKQFSISKFLRSPFLTWFIFKCTNNIWVSIIYERWFMLIYKSFYSLFFPNIKKIKQHKKETYEPDTLTSLLSMLE